MSGPRILDADMQTLGRWIAAGVRWWIDELRGMIPQRRGTGSRDSLPQLSFGPDGLTDGGETPVRGMRCTIAVPQDKVLIRRMTRPMVGDRDLARMLALEGDALLPLPADKRVIAVRSAGPDGEPGRMIVNVAGLPIDTAQTIADAIVATAVRPARVTVDEPGSAEMPFDFLPAMRDVGLIAHSRSLAPYLWAAVGFLVLLNLAVLVWRDSARVARLETLVADQQPALLVSRRITTRIRRDRLIVNQSTALRLRHNALGALAGVSRALPAGAWLQQYRWDGETVRLTGYKPAAVDVAAALRSAQGFSDIRSETQQTDAEVASGQPFDLSARIGDRR